MLNFELNILEQLLQYRMVNQVCSWLWLLSPRWKTRSTYILVLKVWSQAAISLLDLWVTSADSIDPA